jgi:iron(III) transport system substrate-binding protein
MSLTEPGSHPHRRVRRSRPVLLPAVAVLSAGALLAACGSSGSTSSGSSTGSSGTSGSSSTTTATKGTTGKASTASSKKVPLVVYAAEGYDVAEGKAFQKATGIPTQVDDNSTGPLLTKVQAEKNNPQWDLLWVDGATAFATLDDEGLLVKGWTPTVDYNATGVALEPKDHSFYPTGATAAAALVYNSKTVSSPPTSWNALLSSEWEGAVGMNDPAVSGPTYPYIAGQAQNLGGVSAGEAFFSKLKKNGLHVYQTNTNTLQALESGTIKLATIQSSAGIGAGLANKNIKVAFLKPETMLPSVLGIDSHVSAAAQAEAKKFVQFVFSPAGQKVMQSGDPTGDSLFWPLITGEKPLAALPALSSVPTQVINPYTWGPREDTINTWFTDNILQ